MELKAESRKILGKKVKALRRGGLIPAELFGQGMENLHLSIPKKDFAKVYREAGENTVITVLTDDGKKIPALISNVEKDLLKNEILAVDLYGVRMDKEIKAKVPIEFVGVAPAQKGGLLVVKVMNEIEVEAFPNNIPHRFEVDLSRLTDLGQSISVGDLKTPNDVKIMGTKEAVIVTVKEQAKEEAVTPSPVEVETVETATAESVTSTDETEEKTVKKERQG